jgi:hypothetical protein
LLPPTIHLGYLEHVVALLRRAQECIRFVGLGLAVAAAKVLALDRIPHGAAIPIGQNK